jgi:hypothetical protein
VAEAGGLELTEIAAVRPASGIPAGSEDDRRDVLRFKRTM